ncbi:MAG: hypothetical protein WCI04_05420 [archaeon]
MNNGKAKKYSKDVITGASVDPDIVFPIVKDGVVKHFAFEVETGTQIRNISDLEVKTTKNNASQKPVYAEWWYVVTDKYLKQDYAKYHQTLTRSEVKDKIRELVPLEAN